jgi:hypothetical protein
VFAVTTWNDTSQQGLLTQVFQGPTQSGVSVGQPYDDTTFDEGNVTGDPGSFDYGTGTVVFSNDFDTGRVIIDASRLWVTLDGGRLVAGKDYTVSGSVVTIGGSIIGLGQVVIITSFTQSVVPEAISFRIFQDMLGNQRIYRITPDNTTVLTQPLGIADDVIYVLNAADLSEPNPGNNIFGQITINGERITYLTRDLVTNTVSGLRRGTAGTGVTTHAVDSAVIDIGFGELLPARYQKKTVASVTLGDGSTQTYTTEIGFVNEIDVYIGGSVRCYLGATIGSSVEIPQDDFSIISLTPITVQLDFIPAPGLVFQLAYIPTVGSQSVLTVPTTGSTSRWAAAFSATDLVLQSEDDYQILDLNPILVEFDTPVPVKRVVVINDLNSGTLFISQLDIASTTFVTDISVIRPVQVKVGGTIVADTTYTVSSVNPIVVTFDTAPANGIEVEIFIQQALVMYAQGVGTASNGQPLQEQPTLAAGFIEGRV